MYKYQSLTLLKKVLLTSEPDSIAENLVTRLNAFGRQTRQSEMLVTPAIRTEAGRRRFLYTAVNMYNELPVSIKQHGLPRFKQTLKKFLLERQREGRGAT